MNSSIKQSNNAETPRRPWWRLHVSTVIILLLTAAVSTLANWPANEVVFRRSTLVLSHGWPWSHLIRAKGGPLSYWTLTDSVVVFDPAALIGNLLVAVVMLLGVAALFEWRRRGLARVFQATLREGFLVILILAVSFAWLGNAYRKSQAQQRIVSDFRSMASEEIHIWIVGWRHRGPVWLFAPAGDVCVEPGWLGEVYYVGMDGLYGGSDAPAVSRLDFGFLEQLPSLRHLAVNVDGLTDSQIRLLGRLNRLESFSMSDAGIDDADLRHLTGLKKIEYLELSRNQITGDGLKHLSCLSQLQQLELSSNEVTDKGLVHLHGLKRLRVLELSNTQITDEGVDALRQALPELEVYDD